MVRFKMLGRDINSAPTQYRTWVVPNTPDLTGALYTGLKSGNNPFVDITAYSILDDTVIADFNLPLPIWWQSPPGFPFNFYGRKVLPTAVSDAQLAIIDGYAYLFGGQGSNSIFQAELNNPGDWVNTGATLPASLSNSSLAVVNNTIYLFGGNIANENNGGQGAVSHIYSAPTSNPLAWTDLGPLLPIPLHSSSLAMGNGSLYLFGGQNNNGATNSILTASTSNPLSWSIAGTLPTPLFGSTLALSDGFWYLLGGQTAPNQPTTAIYRAATGTPLTWQLAGNLPYATSYGQFFGVGNFGYYMGPAVGDGYSGFTNILQAPIANLTQWIDTQRLIPAVISHSQSAIIYDRLWFFGGSGLAAIFTCQQLLKYDYYNSNVVAYANATRVVLPSINTVNEPFSALGMAYWRTDYAL